MQSASKVCPIVATIHRIGSEWKLIVIRYLMDRPLRFNQLLRLSGADSKTLSRVLRQLEAEGLVRREVISTRPFAVEYSLTDKARELRPVIEEMRRWGEKWIDLEAEAQKLAGVIDGA